MPIKKSNRPIVSVFLFVIMLFILGSCKLGRFVIYNFADINDHKKFQSRPLQQHSEPFKFYTTDKPRAPKTVSINEQEIAFDSYLAQNKTVAFLIIQNDTIQYEKYFDNYDTASIVPSFSMAKSVTSILIGCAIDDGYIQSENDLVIKYLPYLKNNGFDKVTIKHVLQMTSGLDFNESYVNPFGHAASFYYGRNLRKEVSKLKIAKVPGTQFEYVSGNTQLLGMVLEAALKNTTVTNYLQQKLWTPLQMEYDASWSIDKKKNGMEKTFCCLNARARDYAKIGSLYLNKGNWNGKQIVPEKWVAQSTAVDVTEGSAWYYQYQWWLPTRNGDFMAQGILGQYIYVNPTKNLIIVRLGHNEGKVDWWELFPFLASHY
jgi:CubicO group peptidase (beta-lactamase class C family)